MRGRRDRRSPPRRPTPRARESNGVTAILELLGIRRLPYMARASYALELRHLLLWGLFAGLVEGTVSAVVVSKTFGGSNFLITVVQATPAFANLMSLLWGALLIGRPKRPILMALGAVSVSVTLSVCFTPHTPWGGWIFALQVLLSRVFLTGVVSARASIWKSNYPASHRGRATAGLQVIRTLTALPLIAGCGLLFDWDPLAYRWFYPLVSAVGAAGLILFRKARVRGERAALAARTAGGADPVESVAWLAARPWRIVGRMREALRADPVFARYCTAQMCIGTANLMVMPVNTIVLTKVLKLSYFMSNGLLDLVPKFVMLLMLPVWARLFDRVGVLRFRVFNSLCWSGSVLLCGVGTLLAGDGGEAALLPLALVVYSLGRLVDGLAQSGGAIAWNIGHLHFTQDDKAELYMAIHVSLTGLRGLVAPFVGERLYAWTGGWVFMFAFALAALGLRTFHGLAAEEQSRRQAQTPR